MRKLTTHEVEEIRYGVEEGDTDADIAALYDLSPEDVRAIAERDDPPPDADEVADIGDRYDERKFWNE